MGRERRVATVAMTSMRRACIRAGGLILSAVLISACASGGGPEEAGDRGDFGSEAGGMTDPGLSDRGGSRAGAESSGDLRSIFFDFDTDALKPAAKATLRSNAAVLRTNPGGTLEIQGNCDERGTNEYNLALGNRRAQAAKRYLVDLGVDPGRLSTVSYGEENPRVRGSNEEAWAQNRRDDFVLR